MPSEKAMEKAREFWNSVPVAAPKEEWLELYATALDAAREEALPSEKQMANAIILAVQSMKVSVMRDRERIYYGGNDAAKLIANIIHRSLKSPGHREG